MTFVGFILIFAGFMFLVVSGFLWALYPSSFANLLSNPTGTLTTSYYLFIVIMGFSITSVLLVLLGGMIYSSGQIVRRLRETEEVDDEDEAEERPGSSA